MSYSPIYFNPEGKGSATGLVTDYTNASAITAIPQGMATSVNGAGLLVPLDVSNQASWQAYVGYANLRIPVSSSGPIIANGRLQNITISHAIGTALYIGKDGNPTNIAPTAGVNGFLAGDMIMFMGVVVPNEDNPSLKDIALLTEMVGVL